MFALKPFPGMERLDTVAVSVISNNGTYQNVLSTRTISEIVHKERLAGESLPSKQFINLRIREDGICSRMVSASLRLLCYSLLNDMIIIHKPENEPPLAICWRYIDFEALRN